MILFFEFFTPLYYLLSCKHNIEQTIFIKKRQKIRQSTFFDTLPYLIPDFLYLTKVCNKIITKIIVKHTPIMIVFQGISLGFFSYAFCLFFSTFANLFNACLSTSVLPFSLIIQRSNYLLIIFNCRVSSSQPLVINKFLHLFCVF